MYRHSTSRRVKRGWGRKHPTVPKAVVREDDRPNRAKRHRLNPGRRSVEDNRVARGGA